MSPSTPDLDLRFVALRDALARAARNRDEAAPSPDALGHPPDSRDPDALQAAVALVLRASPELELLLIKRAHAERDPWSGHMAFPGGRRDPDDRDLLHTAMRETYEETGIDLARVGTVLGRLEPVKPQSRQLPRIEITPFVIAVPPGTCAQPNSREVDATLWVPLATFSDPTTARTVLIDVSGAPRTFPSFQVGDEMVWGLTYRILTRFLEVVGSADSPSPPEPPPTRR